MTDDILSILFYFSVADTSPIQKFKAKPSQGRVRETSREADTWTDWVWRIWRHCYPKSKRCPTQICYSFFSQVFIYTFFLVQNIGELLSQNSSDLEDKLCKIGDSIVHKLVEWVTRLPFYHQLPKEVHTRLLTHKWHELLVLTTSAYQAIHGFRRMGTTRTDGEKVELHQEVIIFHTFLTFELRSSSFLQ